MALDDAAAGTPDLLTLLDFITIFLVRFHKMSWLAP